MQKDRKVDPQMQACCFFCLFALFSFTLVEGILVLYLASEKARQGGADGGGRRTDAYSSEKQSDHTKM